MAIQAAAASAAFSSPVEPLPSTMMDADVRWAAWHAREVAHDKMVRRRLRIIVPLLIAVGVVSLLAALVW